MKNKPDPKKFTQFNTPKSGCGMGCWSIGCLGCIALVVMIVVGGYYGLMHSSLPLRLIEAAIEQDGTVEVEGLAGSLSSGFSADELRFQTVDGQWSSLTDIKFNYEGGTSLIGSDRLIIKELSVNGGTIYADWNPEDADFDFDPEFGEDMEEFDNEVRNEIGRPTGFKELRIDLVRVANLKILNSATQLEITVDEVSFDGFRWLDGELVSLGKLTVRSSQLDLATVPSIAFADMKNSSRFEGALRTQADSRLVADVPFVVELGLDSNYEAFVKSEIFAGQLKFSESPDKAQLSYVDFTPANFIALKSGMVLPARINMELDFENKSSGPGQVNEDGTFQLGKTQFGDLRIEKPKGEPSFVLATGTVDGKVVTASFQISSPYSPWWRIGLNSEDFEAVDDLWAFTLFGKAYGELSEENKLAVRASMPKPESVPTSEGEGETKVEIESESESGDASEAVESDANSEDD